MPARPGILAGVARAALVPSPSWPEKLSPQLSTLPSDSNASAKLEPAAIRRVLVGRVGTGTGTRVLSFVPVPSWPLTLVPQPATRTSGRGTGVGPATAGVATLTTVAAATAISAGIREYQEMGMDASCTL